MAISDLFSNGEAGAWFSSANLSNMYTDLEKTTNVASDGDKIAVQVSEDLGQSVIHERRQSNSSLRPIYRVRSDGVGYIDYANGAIWGIVGSKTSMNYMHNGTGCTLISFIEKTYNVGSPRDIVSSASLTSQVGFRQYMDSTGTMRYSVYKGGGSPAVQGLIPNACISTPVKMFVHCFDNANSPEIVSYTDQSITDNTNTKVSNPSASSDAQRDITWAVKNDHKEYHSIFLDRAITKVESQDAYASLKGTAQYEVPDNIDYGLILIGQSNQSGRGEMIDIDAEDKQVGVYTYSKSQEFNLATVPEHSVVNVEFNTSPGEDQSTPLHGSSLRAAKNINSSSGKTILLVPLAVGGTSIEDWDTPEELDKKWRLYSRFKRQYDESRSRYETPVIVIVGHEKTAADVGEDIDLVNGGIGNEYVSQMVQFVNNFKRDITGEFDIPIIQVQLPVRNNTLKTTRSVKGAEAQRQLADGIIPNMHLVPSYDLAFRPEDGIHYTRESLDTLADRIALCFREKILGEDINGTGPNLISWHPSSSTTITLLYDKDVVSSAGNYGGMFRVFEEGLEIDVLTASRGVTNDTIVLTLAVPVSGNVTVSYGYKNKTSPTVLTDVVKDSDGLLSPLFGPLSVSRSSSGQSSSYRTLMGVG